MTGERLAGVLPNAKFLSVPGVLSGEELASAFVEAYPKAQGSLGRWFLDEPLHDPDRTWVLSKMWGASTTAYLGALLTLAPANGYDYRAG